MSWPRAGRREPPYLAASGGAPANHLSLLVYRKGMLAGLLLDAAIRHPNQ